MATAIKTSAAITLLEQWGIWSRTALDRLGYVSPLLRILRDNVEGRDARMPLLITDEQGSAIDAAVSLLAKSQGLVAQTLWLHYARGKSFVEVAEKLDCSRKMAASLHDQGVMWIDGFFAGEE